jgi:hypothetical protein
MIVCVDFFILLIVLSAQDLYLHSLLRRGGGGANRYQEPPSRNKKCITPPKIGTILININVKEDTPSPLRSKIADERDRKLNIELQNGRAAMLGAKFSI